MEYYNSYTAQLAKATMQMKFKDECLLFYGVAKDVINDISPENAHPLSVFSMNKKDVYLSVKKIKEEFHNENKTIKKIVRQIETRVEEIINNANTFYNKWSDLKNHDDIKNLKPTFDYIRECIFLPCEQMQSQATSEGAIFDPSGPNCVLALCGMLLFTIFSVVMMPIIIVFYIIFYPLCNLYDCACGRWSVLRDLVVKKLNTGEYKYTNMIDIEIINGMKNLLTEVDGENISLVTTGQFLWPYICKHYHSDDDYDVEHNAQIFYIQITLKPTDTSVVVQEIVTTDVNIEIEKGYSSIPSNEA